MVKRDSKFSFEIDEHGVNEVSEQIMNSYNSGFVGEGTAQTDREQNARSEG